MKLKTAQTFAAALCLFAFLGGGLSRADNDYMVEKGDSLIKIGKLFGVPYQEIMKANGLKSTVIFPDQILRIPSAGRTYANEQAVAQANLKAKKAPKPSKAPRPLEPTEKVAATQSDKSDSKSGTEAATTSQWGEKPGYSQSAYIPPVQGRSKSRGNSAKSATPPNPKTYVVKPGDSIWSISHRFGVSAWNLRKVNKIPYSAIREGQVLLLPERSNSADMAAL